MLNRSYNKCSLHALLFNLQILHYTEHGYGGANFVQNAMLKIQCYKKLFNHM